MAKSTTRVFAEADVKIWKENTQGEIVGEDPLFTYCWAEGITASVSQVVQRRAVTGRGRRKLISKSGVFDDIQIQVRHLYVNRLQEFDLEEIFNPFTLLQIWLDFSEDVTIPEEDRHIWKYGTVKTPYFEISGEGDQSVQCTASFLAERLIDD